MNARFDLTGKVALVTGSSRGIGAALAVGLAEVGADVAIHCAGNLDAADRVVQQVRALGRRSCAFRADLADDDAPAGLAFAVEAQLGPIDILIHNASVQHRQAWTQITREQFHEQITVNFRAVFELTQQIAPAMGERGWGRVLMIGSVQQIRPHPEMAVYAATKSAMDNLMRNLAVQLGSCGVTVNNLAPGVIETDRNQQVLDDASRRKQIIDLIPVGRIGISDDCVGAALLLCSDAGAYITGQTLYVDGGWTA